MDIRSEFLTFFEKKKHKLYSSMPLTLDDPTLLFTNAGMVQFKDIFTGKVPTPASPRAVSCQLCLRAGGKHNDLENVGYTSRHHTLFEMLGNFSFGDYFKEEAIKDAWEFITNVLKLPIEKLWVTIHNNDNEAYNIWIKYISKDRIKRLGDKDNFWSMGETGACGPSSEIFYDQGEKNFSGKDDYLGGDGDRFLEIWNLVFMQYDRDNKGNLNKLPKPSIDTGMGLERVVAIKENKLSNYDSSIFMPIISEIEKLVDKKYIYKDGASFRVIADHIRAVSFLLINGVLFGNEGRGYVLRRILRRAVRHGYLLGLKKPFLYKLVDILDEVMGIHYQELSNKKDFLKEQIELEEKRFFKTISVGMDIFNKELKETKNIFSGDIAFKLYDTFGFPLDLTEDMLKEHNIDIDLEKFNFLMNEQKNRGKKAWKGNSNNENTVFNQILSKYGLNSFVGYDKTEIKTEILTILDENFQEIKSIEKDAIGWIMLKESPFYAESGGQIGDKGKLYSTQNIELADVIDTQKFFNINLIKVKIKNDISFNNEIKNIVFAKIEDRDEIAKHHSATHILQSALRVILGDRVAQAGSSNDSKRLRFDFTYPKALTDNEIKEIEKLVNLKIAQALNGKMEELPIEEAKKSGAIAMFGEKYGDKVRVVSFEDFSIEFCGGTHIDNSSKIGSFYITKESGVSAGVRRIEAVCGLSAINYVENLKKDMEEIQTELKTKDIKTAILKLKDNIKNLKNEITILQNSNKKELEVKEINGVKVIIDEVEAGDIKSMIDEIKNRYESVVTMLFQKNNNKVIIASGIKNSNLKAGDWIKKIAPIVGGGGGGRPDFAQAGGKNPEKIDEAKKEALEYIKGLL